MKMVGMANSKVSINRSDTNSKGSADDDEESSIVCITEQFNLTVVMGDLNYRVMGKRHVIDHLMSEGLYDVMLNNDQLLRERKRGSVL